MVRRTTIVVGICALATLAFAPHAGAVKLKRLTAPVSRCPDQTDSSASVRRQEATMRCMINFARHKADRGKLADRVKLGGTADNKARDILRCQEFSHEACGRDFTYWFEKVDYIGGCWRAGENLAWGNGQYGTVRSLLQAWLRSPGHRANILSRSYDEFGVGMQTGELNGYGGAHVWVTHFGKHC